MMVEFKSNDALKASGGYVNYYLNLEDKTQVFKGTFDIQKKEEDEYVHTFNVDNPAALAAQVLHCASCLGGGCPMSPPYCRAGAIPL